MKRFFLLFLFGGLVLILVFVSIEGRRFADAWTTLRIQAALQHELRTLALLPADETLFIPVRDIRPADIADTWLAPRAGGSRHMGQDIFAKRNTPVFSATEGYITRAGWNNSGGNSVVVTGAGGRRYYYAHLDRIASGVAYGTRVSTSTVLGYVGNTGNASTTPPHLHFSMFTQSGAANPLPLFVQRVSY
jgi:hypothetical protein